ncbi:MAG: type I 3-dehydroquinate dehydratase [Candidatus Peregrinibacteria bacterium]
MICVPVKKREINLLLKNLKSAGKLGDIVEIWFDRLENLDDSNLKKIFARKHTPFIYKLENPSNIKKILPYGVEFIDLDISTKPEIIRLIRKTSPSTKIIMSFHDFKATPPSQVLKKIAKKMIEAGADIVKIAAYAKTFQNSLTMLEFLSHLSEKNIKAICLCMGKEGRITRATGHLFGNYLMYAPVRLSDRTAEGQITAEKLKKIIWL